MSAGPLLQSHGLNDTCEVGGNVFAVQPLHQGGNIRSLTVILSEFCNNHWVF